MSKRNFARMVSIILVIVFTLTGCGNTQQQADLQKKYDSLCARYYELEEDYNELESSYTKLQEEYKKIQDLPDIVISLIDDRDEVVDLTLHSSLEASQKSYTKYYYSTGTRGFNQYNVTITCNNGEKVDDIYWVHVDGEIESVMDEVSNLDNTYTLQITPNFLHVHSLIIKCNGKNIYTSFYATHDLS